MADYIFQSHGKEQGPVSFTELTARVTAGEIAEDTPVRLSDSDQWTAAEDVPGLFRAAKKSRKVANDGAVEETKSNSSHRPAVTSNAPKKKSMPVSSGPRAIACRHSVWSNHCKEVHFVNSQVLYSGVLTKERRDAHRACWYCLQTL